MSEIRYDQEFFDRYVEGSLRSARVYLGDLFNFWLPDSVVDVGCGRGAWLSACRELGVKTVVGLDGNWVRPEMMLDPAIQFHSIDLEGDLACGQRFDLAMSLEVAEHLHSDASDKFVRSLVGLADAILFGAAYIGQPGDNHINSQAHSFWAHKFASNGYKLFDLFRPKYWADDRVEPWYRQNTFLLVRPTHPLFLALTSVSRGPIEDLGFVDCVHPWLYSMVLRELDRLRNDLCLCGSGVKFKHCHGRASDW